MRTITCTQTLFSFDELPDDAKEKARDWYRQGYPFDAECIIDDAADIADLFGLDIRTRRVITAGGGYHYAPSVYFSGFSYQGDGASFRGRYKYRRGGLAAVRAHAPRDTEVHRIAQRLTALQRKYFYCLTANIKQEGRYTHEMTMYIDVQHLDDRDVLEDDAEDLRDCLRDYARWLYRQLEKEYEYQMSAESIDECLREGGYEFDEDGNVL